MSLPSKYDRRIKLAMGMRAVWEPGTTIALGDVVTLKDGIFTDIAHLKKDFAVGFRSGRSQDKSLTLNARGVSTTVVQGGVSVPDLASLAPTAKADASIQFERRDTYFLRTPELKGKDIDNLRQVGRAVAKIPDWSHRDYYIVWKVLSAKQFTFLGNLSKKRAINFSGTGRAIIKFLTLGLSAGVAKTSTVDMDIEIVGAGGPIVIGVTRVKKNGQLRDV